MKHNRLGLLIVGSIEEDERTWRQILGHDPEEARQVQSCREALAFLQRNPVPVVVCERDLPDGNWKDVMEPLSAMSDPPEVIVTSRLADDHLWLEVLNAGGYDVLTRPLDRQEARRTVALARQHWTLGRHVSRRGQGT